MVHNKKIIVFLQNVFNKTIESNMQNIWKVTKVGSVEEVQKSFFGDSKEFHLGHFVKPPEINKSFELLPFIDKNKKLHEGIITSKVIKIEESIIYTKNSIYKLEKI